MKKNIARLLIVAILISLVLTTAVYAESNAAGRQIDTVIILREDGTRIVVPLDDYIRMYFTRKGTLYEFLAKSIGYMHIYGIGTGDKYIEIDEYIRAYFYSPSTALDNAQALDQSEVDEFMIVESVDEETGEVVLKPIEQSDPEPEPEPEPSVDKSKLREKVEEAKEKYSIEYYSYETWKVFEKALRAAEEILENEDVTQEEVDEALEALELAILGLKFGPNIEAKFKAYVYLDSNGYVIVRVFNVPNAVQYSVVYRLQDGRVWETTKALIGSSQGAGPIFYDEVNYYKTVDINIYDADDNWIYTFKDVELIRDYQTFVDAVNNYINKYITK